MTGPRLLWAALAVGVIARVLAAAATNPAGVDFYEWGVIGRNVATGRGFSYFANVSGAAAIDSLHIGSALPSAFMPPGYAYLVAGALHISNSATEAVRVVQLMNIAFAALAILLVFALGRELFDARVGRIAALAFALYPVFIYQSTQVSASNLYICIEIAMLWCLARMTHDPRWQIALIAGVSSGMLAWQRAEAVLVIPFVGAFVWWQFKESKTTRRVATLLFIVPAIVLPATWIVRNSLTFGEPVATMTTTGGFNFWIGNHEGATGSQKEYTVPAEFAAKLKALKPTDDYELVRDAEYRRAAVEYVRDHPAATLARDFKKLGLILTVDVYDSRALNPVYVLGWFLLLGFGAPALWRYRRRGPRAVVVYGWLAYSLAIPVVVFALARYRLSVEFIMVIFASASVVRLMDSWTGQPEPSEVQRV